MENGKWKMENGKLNIRTTFRLIVISTLVILVSLAH